MIMINAVTALLAQRDAGETNKEVAPTLDHQTGNQGEIDFNGRHQGFSCIV
jgi:hypothetical protein